MHRGPQLCWWQRTTGRLHLQQWVLFASRRCGHLCWDSGQLYPVRYRKFLCWRCCCQGRLHVLFRICLDVRVIGSMRHDFCDLRGDRLRRWVRVRRRVSPASRVHLQSRICVRFDDNYLMCG